MSIIILLVVGVIAIITAPGAFIVDIFIVLLALIVGAFQVVGGILVSPTLWIFLSILLFLWMLYHVLRAFCIWFTNLFKTPKQIQKEKDAAAEKRRKKKAAEDESIKLAQLQGRQALKIQCRQHDAKKVLKHLQSLTVPDDKYFAYHYCFQQGKWNGDIQPNDFKIRGVIHTSSVWGTEEPAPKATQTNKVAETKPTNDKERRLLQVECAQHNATKVLKYLHSLQKPDDKYYAYQSCFQEGKWEGILKESDFQLDPDLPQPDNEEVSPDNNPFRAGVKVRINGGNLDGQVGIVSTGEVIDDQIIVLLDHFGKKTDAAIPVASCQLDSDLPQTQEDAKI